MSVFVFSCALLAFSPAVAMSAEVTKKPHLAIITLVGAFSYLLCVLISSIFWAMIKTSEGEGKYGGILFISCVLHNVCRALFVRAYRKTEYLIKDSSEFSNELLPLTDKSASLAGGLGIGFMHALVVCGSMLASSGGDGQYFSDACPYIPVALQISIMALGYFFADMIFTCLSFVANRTGSVLLYVIIFVLQLSAMLTSLGNRKYFGCKLALSMLLVVVVISASFLAWLWPLLERGNTLRRASFS